MPELQLVHEWSEQLESLHHRLARYFARVEPRRRVRSYLEGLLGGAERRNGWHLAEAAGERTPFGMQRLVAEASWDAEAVRDDLQRYVIEHLGDPAAVLVLDETGFLKKGTKSAGVARQYSGTAGRIENCQIGVFLAYAAPQGVAFLDRALYLPENWTAERARCREAGIPEEVEFATKPQLAHRLLEHALEAGVPHAWVVGDEIYGHSHDLRHWLEGRREAYVLAIPRQESCWIETSEGRCRLPVDEAARQVSPQAWQRLSAGAGTKGERLYDWGFLPAAPPPKRGRKAGVEGELRGLLVRRSLEHPEDPKKRAYYAVYAPQGATLAEMVQGAGRRWAIEVAFEAAKQEVGLDQYEVRKWEAWSRFITLALFAHAFLAVQRAQTEKGGCARARI